MRCQHHHRSSRMHCHVSFAAAVCWPPLKYSFLFSSSIADESVKGNDRAMMMIECFKNEESWKTGKQKIFDFV